MSHFGEICQTRAIAYKDLAAVEVNAPKNNLFRAWYMCQPDAPLNNPATVAWKSAFLEFIEGDCQAKMQEYSIRTNPFFDEQLFKETMFLMERYYKLEDSLKMLQHTPKL